VEPTKDHNETQSPTSDAAVMDCRIDESLERLNLDYLRCFCADSRLQTTLALVQAPLLGVHAGSAGD